MVDAQEKNRPTSSRGDSTGTEVLDEVSMGEARVRTARSMEASMTVFGEGPRAPEGRLTIRRAEGGVLFSLGEKEKLSMRNGLDLAARGLLPGVVSLPSVTPTFVSSSSGGDTPMRGAL